MKRRAQGAISNQRRKECHGPHNSYRHYCVPSWTIPWAEATLVPPYVSAELRSAWARVFGISAPMPWNPKRFPLFQLHRVWHQFIIWWETGKSHSKRCGIAFLLERRHSNNCGNIHWSRWRKVPLNFKRFLWIPYYEKGKSFKRFCKVDCRLLFGCQNPFSVLGLFRLKHS